MTHPAPPPGCPAHNADGAPAAFGFPLYDKEFATDPDAVYAHLRQYGAAAPVELYPGVRATLVTSYAAALDVLRTPETFSKDPRRWKDLNRGVIAPDSPALPMMAYRPNALFTDGEDHARLRGAINDSLEQVDPVALRGYVERSADVLIDRFAALGEADLVRDYARTLPLLVFNELFGSPAEFGDRLVAGMSGIFDGVDAERANQELTACLLELVALKRSRPGPDITSWLMSHPSRLTDEEMLHQLVLLMGAGTEPQLNLITNALRLLLSDDRFAGSLAGGSLPVDDALDEVLWTDPPMANYAVHFPVRDAELGGVRLPAGDPVVISFSAANNDPTLAAEHRTGNRAHLAWSAGPHTCPAQSPARLIATVAVEKLLDRLPDLELGVPADELPWRPGPFHRALAALPVRFPPVQPAPAAAPGRTAAPRHAAQQQAGPQYGAAQFGAPQQSAPGYPAPQQAGPDATDAYRAAPSAAAPPSAAASTAAPRTAAPGRPAETTGETSWQPLQPLPPLPAPTPSTPPAATSTARPPASTGTGRSRRWNSLVGWLRGR
ncbi:cytochrome P450 [Kitasatospora herbaricolor]|uniref:cytochrome P450 n=1 Tax=Kitasatospora herbaricolor TaxID=68217 RepID=UPI0019A4162D|nr:cytochrome P450 [Kitasatospora herbaricolor]GGV03443.1 cytochrome P450 [Kitasatospora herbaricolor]